MLENKTHMVIFIGTEISYTHGFAAKDVWPHKTFGDLCGTCATSFCLTLICDKLSKN